MSDVNIEIGRYSKIYRAAMGAENAATQGYVLDASDELVLLSLFDCDFLVFDGYTIFRREDISICRTNFPRAKLYSDYFKVARLEIPQRPELSIGNMREVIEQMKYNHIMIAIEDEINEPGSSWIGYVLETFPEGFTLFEIDTHGRADEETFLDYEAVTCITFGERYENFIEMMYEYYRQQNEKE
jgi:hypothetical protein